MMVNATQSAATLDDLMRVDGKAELISGRIVHLMASGDLPSPTAFEIAVRLREYARVRGEGIAYPDGIGYAPRPLALVGHQTFSPDASYYVGPHPQNPMRFIEGPPTLAVEVRSEQDYGPAAEAEMAEKRADYFAAGTLVVWDVDPRARLVGVFRSTWPDVGIEYSSGEIAEAEPAAPGWRVGVDDLFS